MKNFSRYYFCVDGGETKSHAILYDNNGKILAKSKTLHNKRKNYFGK